MMPTMRKTSVMIMRAPRKCPRAAIRFDLPDLRGGLPQPRGELELTGRQGNQREQRHAHSHGERRTRARDQRGASQCFHMSPPALSWPLRQCNKRYG